MSRAMRLGLAVAAVLAAGIAPSVALAQSAGAAQALNWQSVRAPYTPAPNAVAGGPGNDPQPNSPMFLCRAEVQGSLTPGKWVKGNCDVPFHGQEVVTRDYEVAYGEAAWRTFNPNQHDLIQTGHDTDGAPLYSCRVHYQAGGQDYGYQPGKIAPGGKCAIAYGGHEVVVGWPFEALYAGNVGTAAVVTGAAAAAIAGGAAYHGYGYGGRPNRNMPLCKMGDSDVTLVHGTWAGPNCIPVDIDGKPVPRNAFEERRAQQLVPQARPPKEPRQLCRKDDPDVSLTANGYAGPNCITSNAYGEIAAHGNATPEERARLQACEPGADGVHVENGMLVGADCKSVPEPKAPVTAADPCAGSTFGVRNGNQVTTGNSCLKDEQQAKDKAAADERAAREAEETRQAKEADAKIAQQKADAANAAQLKKAFEDQAAKDKAAADQQAAEAQAKQAAAKAEQDQLAKDRAEQQQREAEAKAAQQKADAEKAEQLQKAFQEQAEKDKAAAEQKAAEEKAEQEKADAEKAEQLKKAFEEQAEKDKAAAEEKAAKEKEDQEKAEQLKKAFEEQAAKDKAAAEPPPPSAESEHSEPPSSDEH